MLFRQIFIIIRIGYKLFCLFFQLLHINIVRTTHQLVVFIQTDLKDVSFLYNNIIIFLILVFGRRRKPSRQTTVSIH